MSNEFFEKICKMWEEGESHTEALNNYYGYWSGTNCKAPADSFFVAEKRTNCNVVQQIVESKLSATLDAQFTASVVPEIYAFTDMAEVKNLQAVADVLDTALKQVLAKNKHDSLKEKVARWGFIKFGASQTAWDNSANDGNGDIVLTDIDPRNLRWTKGGKKIGDLTWIAYSKDMDVAIAKRDYARNDDGSFNIEFCQKLDEAAGEKNEVISSGNNKAVGSFSVEGDNPSAGFAYVKSTTSKGIGKNITIVVMFMFDGTIDAPEESDAPEIEAEKQEMQMKYPNGRIIVFVPKKDKQIILDDKAAPEAFKSLGNIDVFNTIDFGSLADGGEVEALAPIQERINGSYRKLRSLVGGDISAVLFDERMRGVVDDSSLVNFPVQFIEALGDFSPPVIDNGMIEKAIRLKEIIEGYKQEARETAHVNETWMNGVQQKGVQSGEHADALNESAMASIRPIQRNFKDYYISMCEKIVALIVENYSSQRLVEIATGISEKQYAMFDSQMDEDGKEKRSIKFINEAGQIVNEIKLDDSWKFKVEVSSGTEIPRSRRENSRLVDEVAASPIMQSGNIPMIEMYLTAKDFPNRRAVVDMLRKQQEQAAKNQPTVLEQLAKNPDLMKAWSELFKSLEGYSKAQGMLLQKAGLDGTTDTITSAPAQSVTSKSQAKDIALVAPQQISENKKQALFGHEQATDLAIIEHSKGGSNEIPVQ
jgi:hypothetical protein